MISFVLAALSFWMSICVTPKKIVAFLEKTCICNRNNNEFATPEAVRVSCVQIRVRGYKSLHDYLADMLRLATQAVENGSQLVVFPEYVGLMPGTLLPLFGRQLYWVMEGRTPDGLSEVQLHSKRTIAIAEAFQNYLYETYMYTFGTIARLLHVYVAAGSCIFYEQGKLCSRSILFGPDGEPVGAQDKTHSVNFDASMGVTPADRLETFDTPLGRLAIISGLDCYYFENFKIAQELGAQIILSPDSRGSITRDLLRCRAAQSNVYVLYSCYCNPQATVARASIIAPFSVTANADGLIATAESAKTGVITARINLQKLVHTQTENEPNADFLEGDYLHSYVYCGSLPVTDQPDAPDQSENAGRTAPPPQKQAAKASR